jgi:hypothetical protein
MHRRIGRCVCNDKACFCSEFFDEPAFFAFESSAGTSGMQDGFYFIAFFHAICFA